MHSPQQWQRWCPWLIVVAGFLVYANSLGGPFIFDDMQYIEDNPRIRQLWPPWIPMAHTTRPLVLLTLAVNYAVSGLHVWSYHAFNLLIHVAAGVTLYALIRRTLLTPPLQPRFAPRASWLALAAAILWVVHPLQTQSVTYVIQRGESLMGLWYLLTLYCLNRSATSPHRRRWSIACVLACAAGMISKPIMVTAPLMALLYDRVFLAGSFRRAWRERWLLYAGLMATWILLVVVLRAAPHEYAATAGFGFTRVTPLEYARTQPGVVLHYLQLVFWPRPLVLDYYWPIARSVQDIALPAAGILALLGLTAWAWRRRPALGFLGVWFFLILAPSSSVMPIKDLAFEHRMYLSLAAVACVVVLGADVVLRQRLAMTTLLLAAVSLGLVTIQRNRDYHSDAAVWRDVIAKRPHNPRAYNNLGVVIAKQDQHGEALALYEQALHLQSDIAEIYNNKALSLASLARTDEALAQYAQAVRLAPRYADAYNNMGLALASQKRLDEALRSYAQALAAKPYYPKAHNNLAMALADLGRFEEAEQHYVVAVQQQPDYAEAYNNWAVAYAKRGRFAEATARLQIALRLKPDYANACNNMANVLAQQGQLAQAIPYYQEALRLNPRHEEARRNLETVRDQLHHVTAQ